MSEPAESDTSMRALLRQGDFVRFWLSRWTAVLGVQIQSGGVGIDLTQARYAVFHSIGFSLGDFDQAVARLHRPGQTRHVHIYHLVCPDTIDVAIAKAIEAKRDIVESVLEELKHEHNNANNSTSSRHTA